MSLSLSLSLSSLPCLPAPTGTQDARFKKKTRFEVSLLKMARYAIHLQKRRAILLKMLRFTDEVDTLRFTRDFFIPCLSNHMTAIQSIFPRTSNFLLSYPGTLTQQDWAEALQAWQRIRAQNPYTRWTKKSVMRDVLRELYYIRPHTNNICLLRFLAYGLHNFIRTCDHDDTTSA